MENVFEEYFDYNLFIKTSFSRPEIQREIFAQLNRRITALKYKCYCVAYHCQSLCPFSSLDSNNLESKHFNTLNFHQIFQMRSSILAVHKNMVSTKLRHVIVLYGQSYSEFVLKICFDP